MKSDRKRRIEIGMNLVATQRIMSEQQKKQLQKKIGYKGR